uniref:Uncharacterized protein n=1 Tax=Panagrolaimus sp. PS1159 TaxID=55785 RepID=A0AC35GIS4_9BILA
MEGLTVEDFPLPVPEVHYEELNPKKFNKHSFFSYYIHFHGLLTYVGQVPGSTDCILHSFFSYYNHFHGLLTYVGQIPGSTDCILVDKSPYKLLQVEAYIKKIDFDKLESVDSTEIQELSDNGSIVVVANDETGGDSITTRTSNTSGYVTCQYYYQRAKLLHTIPPLREDSAYVLFVDTGKVAVVSIYEIYKCAFDTNAPKILTTIVPQEKLPKIPEEDDFFVYDFMQKKYSYVGCPTKNFNPAPDPHDEVDTDTESVYFGKGAPKIDWEKENELIERPKLDDNSESSEDDSDDEEEDVIYGVQRIAENLGNLKKVESDEEEEGNDEEEEYQSGEEDIEYY